MTLVLHMTTMRLRIFFITVTNTCMSILYSTGVTFKRVINLWCATTLNVTKLLVILNTVIYSQFRDDVVILYKMFNKPP